jgi:hypothetical protein
LVEGVHEILVTVDKSLIGTLLDVTVGLEIVLKGE